MTMMIGAMELHLDIPGAGSLKDKRSVIQSMKRRIENEFHAAVAEVADQDFHHSAVLGVAVVSNDGRHANERLSKIVEFLERGFWDAEISHYNLDVIPFTEY